MAQDPLLGHLTSHPGGGAVKMSDLVGRQQFHDLGVYVDHYRVFGVEHVLAMQISSEPISVEAAIFSDGADFSERDRLLLTMLRPNLASAYRNASVITDLGQRLELLEQGLDLSGLGAIVLAGGGRVRSVSAAAHGLMRRYFGATASHDRLPDALEEWLARAQAPASHAERLPNGGPLIVDQPETRLIARALRRGPDHLILLREQHKRLAPETLARLGLARRECEVLALAASGQTDRQIAEALSISPHTVGHALERIYRKLAVENRSSAVAKALGEAGLQAI
jgi:DNA-binding CsgD family transcriptional regulator